MRPFALSAALAVVAVAASARTSAAQTPRSYSYEFELHPGGKIDRMTHGTVRVSGDRARIDTDDHGKDGDSTYFLLADGGRTVFNVRPGKQTYEVYDADEFAHIVGTALRAAGPVMKVSVRDVRLDTARLGAGARVAGRPTQRVQMRQRWTTSMRVLGFVKEDMAGSAVAEYWTDPSMPLMRNPIFDIVSSSLLALASSDERFMDDTDAARAALFRGSPLKADIRLSIAKDDGDDDTRMRYEVTKITVGGVDEAALTLPKGFRRTVNKHEVRF